VHRQRGRRVELVDGRGDVVGWWGDQPGQHGEDGVGGEATLEGLDSAARKGNHGGRPAVITDDMLHTVLRRRAAGESVETIRPDLIIPTGNESGIFWGRRAMGVGLWAGGGGLGRVLR
jgi:hypothetical protein